MEQLKGVNEVSPEGNGQILVIACCIFAMFVPQREFCSVYFGDVILSAQALFGSKVDVLAPHRGSGASLSTVAPPRALAPASRGSVDSLEEARTR